MAGSAYQPAETIAEAHEVAIYIIQKQYFKDLRARFHPLYW